MNDLESLKKQKWNGSFTIPETDFSFSGNLIFFPHKGIKLEAMILEHGELFLQYLVHNNVKLIHGILSDSNKCTLYGEFCCHDYVRCPERDVVNVKFRVSRAIKGKALNLNTKFKKIYFSITNLNHFFSANGLNKFSYLMEAENETVKVKVYDQFEMALLDLDDVFPVKIKSLKTETNKMDVELLPIERRYITYKKDKNKVIEITYSSSSDINFIEENIRQVTNLFAFLTDTPTLPLDINIFNSDGIDSCELYLSNVREKGTMNLIKSFDGSIIDVNSASVDISQVMLNWIMLNNDYTVLAAIIQNRTSWVNKNTVHGNFLLFVAQIDSIYQEITPSGKSNYEKYSVPIKAYLSNFVHTKLNDFFLKKFNTDIGSSVAGLRNDIAHPQRPTKKFLSKVLDQELYDISVFMYMVVLSKIFIDSGVDEKVTHNYQYRLCVQLL